MLGLTQLRTMARLGQTVSVLSLMAIVAVVLTCLYYLHVDPQQPHQSTGSSSGESVSVFRKLSALGSIGFAMGSQKLFLNIRHDLSRRDDGPTVLGASLVAMVLGVPCPSLLLSRTRSTRRSLFDAIPSGSLGPRQSRRVAAVHFSDKVV